MPKIEELKETYKGQWLAIIVLREDPAGPQEGELLHHCETREEVWRRIRGDSRKIYVTYAGPLLEEGYAAAF